MVAMISPAIPITDKEDFPTKKIMAILWAMDMAMTMAANDVCSVSVETMRCNIYSGDVTTNTSVISS